MSDSRTLRGKILLVDDDLPVRSSLSRALESEGFCVHAAGDEREGLQWVCEGPIDLVLLDLDLAGEKGWETFESISGLNPLMPIIIITARPDQYARAESAGATALMEKPLLLPLLIDTIDWLVHEPSAQRTERILNHGPLVLTSHPAEGVQAWR